MNAVRIKHFIDGHRIALAAVLCLFGLCLINAASGPERKPGRKGDDKVYLVHADELLYSRYGSGMMNDAQVVRGGVIFESDGARLKCDSAYFYQARNTVLAMGNVIYTSGDTLKMTCDSASYEGNSFMPVFRAFSKADHRVHYIKGDTLKVECRRATYTSNKERSEEKKLEAREDVVLNHKGKLLKTDNLNYIKNSVEEKAWYFEGGRMDDRNQFISSDWGMYYLDTKKGEFFYDVKMRSGKWFVNTETLYYDGFTHMAHVVGESTIRNDEDNTIVNTTDAYYNSETDAFDLYNRSMIRNYEDHVRIEADSLLYNKNTGRGEGFGRVEYVDTLRNRELYGDYVLYNEQTGDNRAYGSVHIIDHERDSEMTCDSVFSDNESGWNRGFGNVVYIDHKNKNEMRGNYFEYNKLTGQGYVTGNAWLKDYSQEDTLYMRADTMRLFTYNIDTDSVYRVVHAYYNVRAYRVDMQAVCDSLVACSRDSSLIMYKDPIAWSDNRQILGEVITVFAADSTIREAHVQGQALSIEKIDEENHYNQIAADRLDSYFVDGSLRRTVATGNVKVLFYPVDEKTDSLMFLDETVTDTLRMYLSAERQLQKIWTNKHKSALYPLTQIPPDKYRLREFKWFDEQRPKKWDDIFVIVKKSESDKLKIVKRPEAPLQKFDDHRQQAVPSEPANREEDTNE